MKKISICLILFFLFTSSFEPLYAGEAGAGAGSSRFSFFLPNYAGIGGSYVREDFSGDINFEDSGGLNLKLGFDFFKVLTLELNFDYLANFEGKSTVGTVEKSGEKDILNFMAVLKFPLALSHPLFKPSLLFGMGVFYSIEDFTEKVTGSRATNQEVDTGLSIKFGGSVEIYLSDHFTLGVEGCFVQLIGDPHKTDDRIKFFLITFYILYRF